MKFCNRPFDYLLLDHFDGTVWTCPWLHREAGIIGNILRQPLDEIWHGEKAQEVRNKIATGDFSCCRFEACPYLQNEILKESSSNDEAIKTANSPKFINLAHDYICNLSCETCRSSKFTPLAGYGERIRSINERIAPYIDLAQTVSLSGHGDPFASPYMFQLMQNMRPKSADMSIQLETNGVLFNPHSWKKIQHLADLNISVTITVNSYNKFTYKHISRGGNYEALMRNLDFISHLRKTDKIKRLSIAMVIQDRNFREIPEFIETTLSRYACDKIFLRPVYQWGTMAAEVFWFKDVLNPMHPYHAEYLEIREHPALNHPKVYHFGGRMLHPVRPYPLSRQAN